jgi:hypothetical protein
VEKAEVERARGARREVLEELYAKALELDPASCDALWGGGKLETEGGRPNEKGKARLEQYTRLCPRGAHIAEATQLAGGR